MKQTLCSDEAAKKRGKDLLTETQLVSGRARMHTQVGQKPNALNYPPTLPLFTLHWEAQNMPPPNRPLRHIDYFEVKALENNKYKKNTLTVLLFLRSWR